MRCAGWGAPLAAPPPPPPASAPADRRLPPSPDAALDSAGRLSGECCSGSGPELSCVGAGAAAPGAPPAPSPPARCACCCACCCASGPLPLPPGPGPAPPPALSRLRSRSMVGAGKMASLNQSWRIFWTCRRSPQPATLQAWLAVASSGQQWRAPFAPSPVFTRLRSARRALSRLWRRECVAAALPKEGPSASATHTKGHARRDAPAPGPLPQSLT